MYACIGRDNGHELAGWCSVHERREVQIDRRSWEGNSTQQLTYIDSRMRIESHGIANRMRTEQCSAGRVFRRDTESRLELIPRRLAILKMARDDRKVVHPAGDHLAKWHVGVFRHEHIAPPRSILWLLG